MEHAQHSVSRFATAGAGAQPGHQRVLDRVSPARSTRWTPCTPGEYKAEYEQVTPGARSHDGSYSDLRLLWKGVEARVQSGLDGDDLVILVTPLQNQVKPATLVVECGLLWNKPGYVVREGHRCRRICRMANSNLRQGTSLKTHRSRAVAVSGVAVERTDCHLHGPRAHR
jgi:hypothetical protein